MSKEENDFDFILDKALDELAAGKPIEEIVRGYDKEEAEQLASLLEMAGAFGNLPSPEGQSQELPAVVSLQSSSKAAMPFPRMILKLAASLVVLCSLSFGLNVAATNTVPGDTLYLVKKLGEQIQYMITPTVDGRVELRLTFSQKRMAELVKKSQSGELNDLDLVYEMLHEVTDSLNQLSAVAPRNKAQLFNRMRNMNLEQAEVMQRVARGCSGSIKQELGDLISTCECRENWFGKLTGDTTSMACGGKCDPENCCCGPTNEALSSKLELFPQY